MSAASVWQLLTASVVRDNASPRVTFYERTPGPTQGERIELSGKVLLNWVSKAASLLSEEFDAAPGTTVGLFLPAAHWRTQYWALAVWACGAQVVFADCDADGTTAPTDVDVLVTCCPQPDVSDQVVVTLAALARSAAEPVPAGAFDEAKELSTYPDVFTPLTFADATAPAYQDADVRRTVGELVQVTDHDRAHLPHPRPTDVFAHLAADSGVVLVRGGDADVTSILAQEGL